jgi:hypothetical protein
MEAQEVEAVLPTGEVVSHAVFAGGEPIGQFAKGDALMAGLSFGGPWRTRLLRVRMESMASTLAYAASAIVELWGLAHAIPTRQVIAGFEPISKDTRRIVLQEWLAEAFMMWGVATLVITVTIAGGAGAHTTQWVYRIAAVLLIALAVLTSFTGARTTVTWFKICPLVQAGSAALLLAASLL